MRHESLTEENQETAALYAIGALCQHEVRSVEYHLSEGCEVCQDAVARFQNVVGLLGTASAPVDPPGYLRDALTARIQREPQATPPRVAQGSVIPFPEHTAGGGTPASAPRAGRIVLPWAIAASLLIASATLVSMMQSQRREVEAERNAALTETAALRDGMERLKSKTEEMEQVNSVLTAGNFKTIALAGQAPAPSASARVYWDLANHKWLVSADLPPAPEGKVYQLWFVTADAKISAGLIKPDSAGHGFVKLDFPSNVANLAAAAITLEPAGGSAQPTMPIYAVGKV